jgi:uncharacterized protein (TIGR03083 family)
MSTTVDTMSLAQAERTDLVDLLATFTPGQWNAPSLCAGWRVRDVVAHMFSYDGLGFVGLAGRFLKGGFAPVRVNAVGVDHYAASSTEDLLGLASRHLKPSGLTAGFSGRIALTDGLIHHQDIRRPLNLPRDIPADRLVSALRFARTARPIGAAKRIQGLTLTATDLDWSAGTGPAVEGPAEALLMVVAGRRCALDELSGPGQPILASRIAA